MMRYQSDRNVVYSSKYHVVFCPKYRYKVLKNGVDVRLKAIVRELADERKVGAIECAKMEFARRVIFPYEDRKISENGDVYP